MIYRIYPNKDTFITTARDTFSVTPQTGSNVGASEMLEVFKKSGVSGALGAAATSSLARTLLQFDLTALAELNSFKYCSTDRISVSSQAIRCTAHGNASNEL